MFFFLNFSFVFFLIFVFYMFGLIQVLVKLLEMFFSDLFFFRAIMSWIEHLFLIVCTTRFKKLHSYQQDKKECKDDINEKRRFRVNLHE